MVKPILVFSGKTKTRKNNTGHRSHLQPGAGSVTYMAQGLKGGKDMTQSPRQCGPRRPGARREQIGPTPAPERKPLRAMSAAEFAQWAEARRMALADFVAYAQSYLARRNWPGSETNPTNQRYHAFLIEAADLLAGLAEMGEDAERAAAQEDEEL